MRRKRNTITSIARNLTPLKLNHAKLFTYVISCHLFLYTKSIRVIKIQNLYVRHLRLRDVEKLDKNTQVVNDKNWIRSRESEHRAYSFRQFAVHTSI